MASHVHSMGHMHHGAHNVTTTAMAATTVSMILSNITMPQGMDHGMHDMHNPSMDHPMTNTTTTEGHGGHGMHHTPGPTDPSSGGHDQDHGGHDHGDPSDKTDDGTDHDHGGHDHAGHGDDGGTTDHGGHDTGTGHDGHDMDHGAGSDGDTHDHGTHDETGGSHAGHEMGHSMMFHLNLPVDILFPGWKATTQGELAGACVAWLVLAIVFEGIKALREYILSRMVRSERKLLMKGNRNSDADVRSPETSVMKRMCNWQHLFLSFLQIIQTTLGMFLMLVFMTFNVWLALSVSLGSGVGYFLFGWNKRYPGWFDDDCCV